MSFQQQKVIFVIKNEYNDNHLNFNTKYEKNEDLNINDKVM